MITPLHPYRLGPSFDGEIISLEDKSSNTIEM
jgi:hypothetical protein